tara:strand:+ start:2808 stop:3161 length:354 start_codon:yes stop_codon:yes gene_type:complete
MAVYKNITTGTTTTLISKVNTRNFPNKVNGIIRKIIIANVDGHQADNVCLFLEDEKASTSTDAGNNKFYFFKDVDIPYGATLVIEDNLDFDVNIFHLRIVTQNASDGGTPSLTVIIK